MNRIQHRHRLRRQLTGKRNALGHRVVMEIVAEERGITVAQMQAELNARRAKAMAIAIAKHIPIRYAKEYFLARPI